MSESKCHAHQGSSCREAYDLLFDFLEGHLPDPSAQDVRTHFERCPPCLKFLESYRQTPGLCRKALEQQVPAEVTERLLSFLRQKLPPR